MTATSSPPAQSQTGEKMDMIPIMTIALAQILIAANIASLSISIGAIVEMSHG